MSKRRLHAPGRHRTRLAKIVALAAVAIGLVSAAPADHDTLEIEADLEAQVMVSGQLLRIQASPSSSPTLILNPDAAERIAMGKGMFGARVNVGPTVISGRTAVLTYEVAGRRDKRRAVAFERAIAPRHDGTMGPEAFPHQKIVYRLRQASPGERRIALPMADDGFAGAGTMIRVAGEDVFVKWALHRRLTIATAGAAADVAVAQNGLLEGEPWRETIAFDVQRPVRRLRLRDPLVIGPVTLESILARTADYGDASAIADAEADASEIVVRGNGKAKGRTRRVLEIGSNDMQHCSSLIFDKPARKIILNCR